MCNDHSSHSHIRPRLIWARSRAAPVIAATSGKLVASFSAVSRSTLHGPAMTSNRTTPCCTCLALKLAVFMVVGSTLWNTENVAWN